MTTILWRAAAVVAGLIAVVGFRAARRADPFEVGSVSASWIAEHRATNDPDG